MLGNLFSFNYFHKISILIRSVYQWIIVYEWDVNQSLNSEIVFWMHLVLICLVQYSHVLCKCICSVHMWIFGSWIFDLICSMNLSTTWMSCSVPSAPIFYAYTLTVHAYMHMSWAWCLFIPSYIWLWLFGLIFVHISVCLSSVLLCPDTTYAYVCLSALSHAYSVLVWHYSMILLCQVPKLHRYVCAPNQCFKSSFSVLYIHIWPVCLCVLPTDSGCMWSVCYCSWFHVYICICIGSGYFSLQCIWIICIYIYMYEWVCPACLLLCSSHYFFYGWPLLFNKILEQDPIRHTLKLPYLVKGKKHR